MKKIALPLLAFSMIFTSCTAAPSATAAPVAPTQSLSEIDLDAIPFQPNDLPNQYTSGQISYTWAADLPKPVEPQNVVIQKVGWSISAGFKDDYVMIALFDSASDQETSYEAVRKTYSAKPAEPSAVGDRSAFVMISTFSGEGFLVFTQCTALVAIHITGADVSEDLLTSYAQRIAKRLKPLICPS